MIPCCHPPATSYLIWDALLLFWGYRLLWEDSSHVCAPCCFLHLPHLQAPGWAPCCPLWPFPPIFPAFLVSDSLLRLFLLWCHQAPVPRDPSVQGVWNVTPTWHTGSCFPSFQKAPGLEIPVNVCWFLGSGMCVYASCGWDNWLYVPCDGDMAKGRWRKGILKTRALGKINLNGNLKAENQLLFKWIILKVRF